MGRAYEFILQMTAGGGTNINSALLKALEIAKRVKDEQEIDIKTEQVIDTFPFHRFLSNLTILSYQQYC